MGGMTLPEFFQDLFEQIQNHVEWIEKPNGTRFEYADWYLAEGCIKLLRTQSNNEPEYWKRGHSGIKAAWKQLVMLDRRNPKWKLFEKFQGNDALREELKRFLNPHESEG